MDDLPVRVEKTAVVPLATTPVARSLVSF